MIHLNYYEILQFNFCCFLSVTYGHYKFTTLDKQFSFLLFSVYDPTCSPNINLTNVLVDNDCDIDPDYIEFNCSIAYRGNVPPAMQLQMSGHRCSR